MTNFFGKRGFTYANDGWEDNFQEILEKLKKLVDEGKVRHVGLSNENPWGFMKFIEYSKIGLPKMITIQNPYSLLNRLFEVGNPGVVANVALTVPSGTVTGNASAVGVDEGIYYTRGTFVRTEPQFMILDPYSTKPTNTVSYTHLTLPTTLVV